MRVDSKKNKKIKGTGLGLAIAKQLVEQMDGMIWVESVYGKGSSFFVQFPMLNGRKRMNEREDHLLHRRQRF